VEESECALLLRRFFLGGRTVLRHEFSMHRIDGALLMFLLAVELYDEAVGEWALVEGLSETAGSGS
jgi:hypothetical protein